MYQSVITVREEDGQLLVGVLHNFRGDTLTIDLPKSVREQACLEWRLEVERSKAPFSGMLRVIRVRPQPDMQRFRVFGQVEQILEGDLAILSAWAREQRVAEHRREGPQNSTELSVWSGSQYPSDSEARPALARLSRRRWMRASRSELPRDGSAGPGAAVKDGGRHALRKALHRSMARKRRRAQWTEVSTGGLPSWATEQALPASLRPSDPEVVVVPHTLPLRIQVRYQDRTRYAEDYARNISRHALFLPVALKVDSGTMLTVSISPPGQAMVTCKAEIQVQMPDGVGVALLLSRAQVASLAPAGCAI